jgi:hypothetical protein
LTDRQRFNGVVSQFEREMSHYYSLEGDPESPQFKTIMSWFFNVPEEELNNLYTVEANSDPDSRYGIIFRFSEAGKARLREALVARFGDGLSTDVRNSLQEAIASGRWVAPAANPAA